MQTNDDPNPTPAGADPAAAAAAAANPPAAESTPPAAAEAPLVTPPVAGAPVAGDTDYIPEKFRVAKEDGTVDEAASARKMAASYAALEAHKGALPVVPATPDDYKFTPAAGVTDAVDVDAWLADPLSKEFFKDAHAAGLTNEQLDFVVNKYLTLAPEMLGVDVAMTATEAKAELGKLWADEPTLSKNLTIASRAIQGFGGEADDMPGSRAKLFAKYGSDPDFLAFAARIGAEMQEDKGLPPGGAPGVDDIEALMKGEAYRNALHPDHVATAAKVKAHFDKHYGTGPRK
jgi:hypothetical protein